MNAPFRLPVRLPLDYCIAGAGLVLAMQLAAGADPLFAGLVFGFILLSVAAVNLLGGLVTVSGLSVSVLAVKSVVLSQVIKAFLWEPGDRNLEHPLETVGVLTLGMAGIFVAALVSAGVQPRRSWISSDLNLEQLRTSAVLTYLLGLGAYLGMAALGGAGEGVIYVGGVAGICRQLTFTLKLSIVFSTAWTILASDGRRSLSLANGIPLLTLFSFGVLNSSKEAMFDSFLLFGLTALAFRFRFRGLHLALLLVLAVFAQSVLHPFAQLARNVTRGYGLAETVRETGKFLAENFNSLESFRRLKSEYRDTEAQYEHQHYFAGDVGLVERFSMIKTVDVLVAETLRQGNSGWETVTHGFRMLLPRAINPSKPAINTGNFLGHKAGMLDDDDGGTQVSFGFIADAFSAFRWTGAFVIPCVIMLGFTLIYRHLVGPIDHNVWAVFLVGEFQHSFTEQTISSMSLTILQSPVYYLALATVINFAARRIAAWRNRPTIGTSMPAPLPG